MLTAEQKVRMALTGDPHGVVTFQHEGRTIVRMLSGGNQPPAFGTFEHRGVNIVVHCPVCDATLGTFDASYGVQTSQQLAVIRNQNTLHECGNLASQ